MNVKDIVSGGTIAKFSHYISGNLYYQVETENGTYQFPISTVDHQGTTTEETEREIYTLSEDLGTTTFDSEIKAITLMRWIRKAIDKELCVKIN